MTLQDCVSLGNLVVLSLTLLAIIWYSRETHLLRRITQWSIELQNRPILVLEHEETASGLHDLYISNIGRSPALDISFRLWDGVGSESEQVMVQGHIDIFPISKRRFFKDCFYKDQAEKEAEIISACLDPRVTTKSRVIKFEYSDIAGVRYLSHYTSGTKGLSLQECKKL